VKFASLSPGSESATADLLRRTIQNIDPLLAVLELRTFEKHVDGNPQLWIVRAGAALFSIFGGLALGLAVIGVYGVKACRARVPRDRDPVALGAQGKTVLWMILREGLASRGLSCPGLLSRWHWKPSQHSFQVSSTIRSPSRAPVVLLIAALVATWLPAGAPPKSSMAASAPNENTNPLLSLIVLPRGGRLRNRRLRNAQLKYVKRPPPRPSSARESLSLPLSPSSPRARHRRLQCDFLVVNVVLLQPLDYPEANRIVAIRKRSCRSSLILVSP
jgi:hypothetical protein